MDVTPGDIGGLAALVMALFFVGRSIMADARFSRRLDRRIAQLEVQLRLEQNRRYQLEGILRTAGLPIPNWPDPNVGDDTADDLILVPHTRRVR